MPRTIGGWARIIAAESGEHMRDTSTAPALLPTTSAQVSGHRFLRRRVEHGLVFGDIRMIHDPLGTRSRALLLGVIATVLTGLGAGLMAWASPNPDPGDAVILADEQGGLYARVGEDLHPVANLASARLIAGEPADPASIGAGRLADTPLGSPLGIPGAPGLIGEDIPDQWSVCWAAPSGEVVVRAGAGAVQLREEEAVLVRQGGSEWVLTAEGRRELPPAQSPAGRVLRRGLGIDADTPAADVPAEVLSAVREHPAWRIPEPVPEVLHTDSESGSWAVVAGEVASVTPVQAGLLADAGAAERWIDRAELAAYPSFGGGEVPLPRLRPEWVDPVDRAVCADEEGRAATAPPAAAGVALSGRAVADRFSGPGAGAFAVDTGYGLQVVSGAGRRHATGAEELAALGFGEAAPAPWEILRLLPEGEKLSREAALRATY